MRRCVAALAFMQALVKPLVACAVEGGADYIPRRH
jgi:hypothetical protein